MSTLVIQPSIADTTINQDAPDAPDQFPTVYTGFGTDILGQNRKRGFLRFGIVSAMPVGATITSATLTMWYLSSVNLGPYKIEVVNQTGTPWAETITWNTPDVGGPPVVGGGPSVTGVCVKEAAQDINVLTLVQHIYTNGITGEFRWIGNPESSIADGFRPREYATTSKRPKITIVYTLPSAMFLGDSINISDEGIGGNSMFLRRRR